MSAPDRSRRLGKGLSALIGAAAPAVTERASEQGVQTVPLDRIRANPYQPRKKFRAEDLADLEASLKASGLLQPITLRPAPAGGGYELVAGERRFRAATRLGWTEIPAIVREVDDRTLLTLALVENLQRADLNAMEEADGYQRLVDEFGLSQQEVADVVGKDRSTVANFLRLLGLPPSVRRLVQDGKLSSGHGRTLLALASERAMQEMARAVVEGELSVRETERRVRAELGRERNPRERQPARDSRPAEVRRIEAELREALQTDVSITLAGGERGKITVEFYSGEDFNRVVEKIVGDRGDFD